MNGFVISSVSSSSGKTTVSMALCHKLRQMGYDVQAFKSGPDYIDTAWLSEASQRRAHNLDHWLCGEGVSDIYSKYSRQINVVEGAMGLFDGGEFSTANLAHELNLPVILVVDVRGLGETVTAIVHGLIDHDRRLRTVGVILNNVGSARHLELLRQSLDGLPIFGWLWRDETIKLPERHLGLMPQYETQILFEELSAKLELDVESFLKRTHVEPPRKIELPLMKREITIALARDKAFNFYYEASLSELERFGARLIEFSPLVDERLPEADGLLIGGGFPEMFAQELSRNETMRLSIAEAIRNGMPCVAECGGYMYLHERLTDFDGRAYEMCGVFEGTVRMTRRLQRVGYVSARLRQASVMGDVGDEIRGHEFHYSTAAEGDALEVERVRTGERYPSGKVVGKALGSYLHIHFVGNPAATENFIAACEQYKFRHLTGLSAKI